MQGAHLLKRVVPVYGGAKGSGPLLINERTIVTLQVGPKQAKASSFSFNNVRKEDPVRLAVVGLIIMLITAARPCKYVSCLCPLHPATLPTHTLISFSRSFSLLSSRYATIQELLVHYPEFSTSGDLERALLLENANIMTNALAFIIPSQNKGVLLSVVPRLAEGPHVKYVTGGGSSRATLDRVLLFEREGNYAVKRRSVGVSARNKRKAGQNLAQVRPITTCLRRYLNSSSSLTSFRFPPFSLIIPHCSAATWRGPGWQSRSAAAPRACPATMRTTNPARPTTHWATRAIR